MSRSRRRGPAWRVDRGAVSAPILISAGLAGLLAVGAGLGAADVIDLVGEEVATSPVDTRQRVAFRDCPNGAALGEFAAGDHVWAMATDADGDWAAVRAPGFDEAWVPTAVLVPDDTLDGLPVWACGGAVAGPDDVTTTTAGPTTTSTRPPSTTTTGPATPTTSPASTTTKPKSATTTTTTTTTTAPDTTDPQVSPLSISPGRIFENQQSNCSGPKTATVTATVSDQSPVSATLTWRFPSGNPDGNTRSETVSIAGDQLSSTIGPEDLYNDLGSGPPQEETIKVTVTVTDSAGNATTVTSTALTYRECI